MQFLLHFILKYSNLLYKYRKHTTFKIEIITYLGNLKFTEQVKQFDIDIDILPNSVSDGIPRKFCVT
jgi:hypothetical protein